MNDSIGIPYSYLLTFCLDYCKNFWVFLGFILFGGRGGAGKGRAWGGGFMSSFISNVKE